jgi:hypothetical protein
MIFLSYEFTISSVDLLKFCLQLLDSALETHKSLVFFRHGVPRPNYKQTCDAGVLNLEARDGAFLPRNLRQEYRSRFQRAYHAYEFMNDLFYLQAQDQRTLGDEWTRGLNSAKSLSMSVQLKAGISEDVLERFGKTCQTVGKRRSTRYGCLMA